MRILQLIFAFACTAIGQTTNCPEHYDAIGIGCYTFPDMDQSSWIEARALCQLSGGDLVNIESFDEQRDLLEYVQEDFPGKFIYWIGATGAVTEGKWLWVSSGATVDYENWASAEPLLKNDCAYWNPDYNDWYTDDCYTSIPDYEPLCEAKPL